MTRIYVDKSKMKIREDQCNPRHAFNDRFGSGSSRLGKDVGNMKRLINNFYNSLALIS
jgi:hypothetical protein